jgi:DNA ligase-4
VPHLDKERATYGIKDKTLANIYVDILSIRGSQDAESLINWKKPSGGNKVAGDFGEVLYSILQNRAISVKGQGLSVAQVNEKLDALNASDNM